MIATVNSAIHQFNNTGTVTHHTGLFLSYFLQHFIFHKNNQQDDTSGFVVL